MTRDELILQFERLPWKEAITAQRWAYPLGTLDDIAQVAFIGLVNAADKFDPSRGVKFITYATWAIRNTLRRAVEDSGFIRIPSSTLRAMHSAPDPNCRLQRAAAKTTVEFPGDLEHVGREYPVDDRLDLAAAVASLPKRLRRVVRMRFYEHMKLKEIGVRLRVTKSRAQQLIEDAIRHMRQRFEVEGKPRRRKPAKLISTGDS